MRTLPTFDKRTQKDDSGELMRVIAIALLTYSMLAAISRVISGHGSKLDIFVCAATPACLFVLYVWYSRKAKQDERKLREERQKWKEACKSVEVAIVNRHHSGGGTYEDGYYPGEYHHHSPSYRLQLEPTGDQRMVAPNQTVVDVSVNNDTYEKLEKRDTVRIYYKPERPFTFLLEEEL